MFIFKRNICELNKLRKLFLNKQNFQMHLNFQIKALNNVNQTCTNRCLAKNDEYHYLSSIYKHIKFIKVPKLKIQSTQKQSWPTP